MSVWNPENIKDVAEAIGINNLHDDVTENLARDVEYRISQVLEEALKFMRHAKRNVMTTQDISQALRLLDVEPLYGYETTRPLKFGEATLGPGQPLFYVEDDEVDFEKLINAPLPKVPREISFTAHWLAIEGVQPSIPQNPSSTSDVSRLSEQMLLPKGPNANPNLAAMSGRENVNVKPLVKHILSKELQLYFEKVCSAILDETNDDFRISALASLREDPGLHQLVPYFVQFISEKVTHGLKDLFVLTQVMYMTESLIENKSLYIDPYVPSLVPPVLTCLIGSKLGSTTTTTSTSSANPYEHFTLRDTSASLIGRIAKKYAHSSHTLRPRLARTFLKCFLDPGKPLGTHYGAIVGLRSIGGGPEVIRELIVPNLAAYDVLLKEAMGEEDGSTGAGAGNAGGAGGGGGAGRVRRIEAEKVVETIVAVLATLGEDMLRMPVRRREDESRMEEDLSGEMKEKLKAKIGDVVGERIIAKDDVRLVRAILDERTI